MTKCYWDSMTKHAHEHCNACRHYKIDISKRVERPPQCNPISTCPMQTVHANLITNVPLTTLRNTTISVRVDVFTGRLMLSAHGHQDADTIARGSYAMISFLSLAFRRSESLLQWDDACH